VVFLAHDPALGRDVALKVPRPEAVLDPELRRRFVQEARAMAGLDHPHVVPVHETGQVGAICYIASAYCAGLSLADWLERPGEPAPARDAAGLVATLAEAVQYLHARGVLHRDLKPANVLLAGGERQPPQDAEGSGGRRPPLADCAPRITDFGLAKLLQDGAGGESAPTRSGALLGTPAYMAPEQAEGRQREVGPHTDVWALGVILYEVLTGRPPFQAETELETLRRLSGDEPVSPRCLRPDVPRDLEAICLKCLEKAPPRRYGSARALGEDLRRFLDGRPTRARPLPWWRRGLRWLRRRPGPAALACAGAGLLALLSAVLWYSEEAGERDDALRKAARREQQRATEAERELAGARARAARKRQQEYATGLHRAATFWEERRTDRLGKALDALRPGPGEDDLRGFEWHYLRHQSREVDELRGHRGVMYAVAAASEGRVASVSADGAVKLWDVWTRTASGGWSLGGMVCRESLAFSAGARRLVSFLSDRPVTVPLRRVTLWDVLGRKRLAEAAWPAREVFCVALSPDGRTVAIGGTRADGAGVVHLWEPESARKRVLATFGKSDPSAVAALCFSPDGGTLAAGCHEGALHPVQLIEVATGKVRDTLAGHRNILRGLAFALDGKTLASAGEDGRVTLWDVATGRERLSFDRLGSGWAPAVTFSPDGKTVAAGLPPAAKPPGSARLWEAATGAPRAGLPGPGGSVVALAFTADGQSLVLGYADHIVRLWRPAGRPEAVTLPGHDPEEAWAVAFAPDGRTLASSGEDHAVRLWDAATAEARRALKGHRSLVSCVAFAPQGKRLASGGYDKTVKLWDAAGGKLLASLEGHTGALRCLAFSPDGKVLASGGKDGRVKVWDVATGRERLTLAGHTNQVRGVAFSPDGRLLVSAGHDQRVRVYDAATGRERYLLWTGDEVQSVAISGDGQVLVAGHKAGVVRLWDLATGKERSVLRGHTGGIRSVAFTPDGKTLASGSADWTVKLWHVATGHELLTLRGNKAAINSVAFSGDGRTLAAASHDGSVRLYRAPRGE
jgi:WD40 repeat protein